LRRWPAATRFAFGVLGLCARPTAGRASATASIASRRRSMLSRSQIIARTAAGPLLLVYFVLAGCHSSSPTSAPAIAFRKVPAAYLESPYNTEITEREYKTDMIEGRVTGARRGLRLVLYANTDGRWGVCRQSGQPFTNIASDGRWKASVHL